jgi:hypothetical protein
LCCYVNLSYLFAAFVLPDSGLLVRDLSVGTSSVFGHRLKADIGLSAATEQDSLPIAVVRSCCLTDYGHGYNKTPNDDAIKDKVYVHSEAHGLKCQGSLRFPTRAYDSCKNLLGVGNLNFDVLLPLSRAHFPRSYPTPKQPY